MKRKIEKFLAKKQGVDENKIRYKDDGRFDFMGDVEGVLTAVRGKGDSAGRGRRSDKKPKKPVPAPTNLMKKKLTGPPGHPKHHSAPMHPGQYSHYGHYPPPYMHGRYMPYHMPPSMPYPSTKPNKSKSNGAPDPYGKPPSDKSAPDKENTHVNTNRNDQNRIPYSPDRRRKEHGANNPVLSIEMSPAGMKTPFKLAGEFSTSKVLASARKTIFDSPKPLNMNLEGMTPLPNKNRLFSPGGDHNMALFSPRISEDLNKTLFGDESDTLLDNALKTPKQKQSRRCLRFRIGEEVDENESVRQQLIISPISHKKSAPRIKTEKDRTERVVPPVTLSEELEHSLSVSFADESEPEAKNDSRDDRSPSISSKPQPCADFSDAEMTPRKITQDDEDDCRREIAPPSPFDTSAIVRTPCTTDSKSQSFWNRTLEFSPNLSGTSFTPFKSPAPLPKVKLGEPSPNTSFVASMLDPSDVKKERSSPAELPSPKKRKTVEDAAAKE